MLIIVLVNAVEQMSLESSLERFQRLIVPVAICQLLNKDMMTMMIYTVSRKKGATDFFCCNFYKY